MLYLASNQIWKPLPAWADFLIQAGHCVAQQPLEDTRLVLGLALPTRAYAAALCSLGIVKCRCIESASAPDPEEHLNALLALPEKTPLRFLLNDEMVLAVHGGRQVVDGETRLKIMYEDPRAKRKEWSGRLLNATMALGVAVAADHGDRMLSRKITRRVEHSDFLSCFLGDSADPTRYTLDSCVECAILGPAATLREEICDTKFAFATSDGQFRQGSLQDILRVRRFLSDGEPCKTQVFSIGATTNAAPEEEDQASVVVFDSALAFIRWRDFWRGSHWLVLLDRTDRQYWDGAQALNDEWRQNRLDNMPPQQIGLRGPIPDCVEAVLYEDAL